MRSIAYVTAAIVLSGSGSLGFGHDLLQQRLNSQFALTQITKDRAGIVSAGAVLVLRKSGLMMYSIASPLPPVNTYKNGKISQGASGFGRDFLIWNGGAGKQNRSQLSATQVRRGRKALGHWT